MTSATKSSDKTFGLFFVFVFTLISALQFNQSRISYFAVSLIIAVALLLISLIKPKKLNYLNCAWSKLSTKISKITSPLIMGIIFITFFIPISLIGKMRGRDELHLKFKSEPSYWLDVSPEYSENFSFRNQY